MIKKSRILSIFIFLILLINFKIFAEDKYNVYFYGAITPPSQENQKNITLDLFSAQIRSFPNINFIDKRDFGFDENYNSLSDTEAKKVEENSIFDLIPNSSEHPENSLSILLVCKIYKSADELWVCKIYSKNLFTSKINVEEKSFDSYYKILTDSKTLFTKILSESTNHKILEDSATKQNQNIPISPESISIEGLSGTWTGESGITKIVIMRSGRGFVIFNNGASMNISILVEESDKSKVLKITQAMPFNASFYPNIPRKQILDFAQNAKPIQWIFNLTENGNLAGTKNTLALTESGTIKETTETVQWKKIN